MSCEAPREALATIEVRVWDLAQLFDAVDPSPSSKRALERGAESYILSRAGEQPAKTSLRLLIRGPETLRAQVGAIAEGIHGHFKSAHARSQKKFRRRMRVGGISLGVGLAVLGASMGLRSLLPDGDDSALAKGLGRGC